MHFFRKIKGSGNSFIEAAQRAREEQRKRKALMLRKKLRKAKKRVRFLQQQLHIVAKVQDFVLKRFA